MTLTGFSDATRASTGRERSALAERRPASSSSLDGIGFNEDQLDAIRALCGALWTGSDTGVENLVVLPADADQAARDMIAGLRLDTD